MDILEWADDTENSDITIDHDFKTVGKTGFISSIVILWKVITGQATVLLVNKDVK